jgi:hypothetical protein
MYLAELAAHAWDVAFATGQVDRLDPSLAVSALDAARAMIKPEYRDMVATGFAPSVRRFRHLLMPMTGNALPPSWDATLGHRSTGCASKRGRRHERAHQQRDRYRRFAGRSKFSRAACARMPLQGRPNVV